MLRIGVIDRTGISEDEMPKRDGVEYLLRIGWAELVEQLTGRSLQAHGTRDRRDSNKEDRVIRLRNRLVRIRRKRSFSQIKYLFKGVTRPEDCLTEIDGWKVGPFAKYGEPLSLPHARALVARLLADEALTDKTEYMMDDFFMPDLTSLCMVSCGDGKDTSLEGYLREDWSGQSYARFRRKAEDDRPKRFQGQRRRLQSKTRRVLDTPML
jgi:hypothetical protein